MSKKLLPPIIIGGIAIVLACIWFYLESIKVNNPIAEIYQGSVLLYEIPLNDVVESYEIEITDDSGHSNTVFVSPGQIEMIAASCPDQICVKTGAISNGVKPIVCLPNEVRIVIVAGDDGDLPDMVVG